MGDGLADRVVELTAELVRVDSVSPTLDTHHRGEAAVADLLDTRLRGAGFTVRRVGDDPARPSLLATRDGSAPGPWVVLNGHLDTVPVDGMAEPFEPRIADGRLFGRGASDMKGGVAGLVVAAEELAALDTPGRLTLALVADEEDASIGAAAVLDEVRRAPSRPDVCLIAEPTWLDLASAHRGYQVIRITMTGRASHSSQPREGVDVVPTVAALLTAIQAQHRVLQEEAATDGLDGGSLMATVVRAGSAPFTTAASAEVVVERRTLPTEPPTVGSDEIARIVAALDPPAGLRIEARSVIHRSPWRTAASGPAHRLGAALSEALGRTGRRGFPYWMESALWEEAGIPTVVCGPAGGGLHATDEWIDLDQLRAYPEAVVAAVGAFARGRD